MESVANIQKMVEAAKQDAIKLANQLVEMIDALKQVGVADAILNDKEFKKAVGKLGISEIEASPVAKGKKGKRKPMSAEAKKLISEKAKARWKKAKAAGKSSL